MLLALATLVVAGLSSANNAGQARGRQNQLRGRLGLPTPVLAGQVEALPGLWKRLRWIVQNRDPLAVGLVFQELKHENIFIYGNDTPFQDDVVQAKVIAWLVDQTQKRLRAGELPWPGQAATEMHTRLGSFNDELENYASSMDQDPRESWLEAYNQMDRLGGNPYAEPHGSDTPLFQIIKTAQARINQWFAPHEEALTDVEVTLNDKGELLFRLIKSEVGWGATVAIRSEDGFPHLQGMREMLGPLIERVPNRRMDWNDEHFVVNDATTIDLEGPAPRFWFWPDRDFPSMWIMFAAIEDNETGGTHGLRDTLTTDDEIRVAMDVAVLRVAMSQIRERTLVIARHYGHLVDMVRGGAFPDLGARDLDSVFIEVMVDERQMIIDGVAEQLGYTSQVDEGKADAQEHALVTYEDGAQIVEITGMEALKREGLRMVHCIGDRTYGHPQKLEEGRTRAFSYRDPTGKPRATVTVFKPRGGPQTTVFFTTDQNQGPHNGPIHDVDARRRFAVFLADLRGGTLELPPSLRIYSHADINRFWPNGPSRGGDDLGWLLRLVVDEDESITDDQDALLDELEAEFTDRMLQLLWENFPDSGAQADHFAYLAVGGLLGEGVSLPQDGKAWVADLQSIFEADREMRRLMDELEQIR
jgi:hypothetical protein